MAGLAALKMNSSGESHIYIYDDISSWGFSANDLQQSLQEIPVDAPITVHINSMGGDVFQGLAIYNLLSSRKNVTTVVEGIAASISSIIFLAGEKREMFEESFLMIHDPSIFASGTLEEIENMVELLKKAGETARQIYLKKSNITEDKLEEYLSKDTYFTTSQALELGLATGTVSVPNATAKANLTSLVAKLSRSVDMKFETWLSQYCEPLGLDPSTLTVEQKASLKAKFDEQQAANPPAVPQQSGTVAPTVPAVPAVDLVAQQRAEAGRIDDIRGIADRYEGSNLNEDYLTQSGVKAKTIRGLTSHAIREGWDVDKFELELRRAEVPSIGHVGIHTAPSETDAYSNPQAVSCALVRQAGVVATGKHNVTGDKYGYEDVYDQKTLEASDHPSLRDTSLLQILERFYMQANGRRYEGRLATDGFIRACRDAMWKLRMDGSNTSWTGLDIFDDAANKMLWAAYNATKTTWQEWVYPTSVSDFKIHNFYRMTMEGGYQKVGADGRLKHGGLSDDKYTTSADTFGKLVGLNRHDIINDDLGALNRVMSALGIEGNRFLEELFYGHLLNNLGTIFTAGNKNLISGAGSDLTVDGLTTAGTNFSNQVDSDGAPIAVRPSLLLVGTQDEVLADELFTKTNLRVVQTANSKGRPDDNPHTGKYRPVATPFLNNTDLKQRTDALDSMGDAFPGQDSDQWFLLPSPNNPYGGIILGAFLNGVKTPTVEQADQAFDVLGLQWRAYQDAGVSSGDPKLGLRSAGA